MLSVSLCHCGEEWPLIWRTLTRSTMYINCYIQTDQCLLTGPPVTLLMPRVVLLFKAGMLIIQLHILLASAVFIAFTQLVPCH